MARILCDPDHLVYVTLVSSIHTVSGRGRTEPWEQQEINPAMVTTTNGPRGGLWYHRPDFRCAQLHLVPIKAWFRYEQLNRSTLPLTECTWLILLSFLGATGRRCWISIINWNATGCRWDMYWRWPSWIHCTSGYLCNFECCGHRFCKHLIQRGVKKSGKCNFQWLVIACDHEYGMTPTHSVPNSTQRRISTLHYDMVGDKAWNEWNHGTSAKPWNEWSKCIKTWYNAVGT
jgi:hypothetical protein